MRFGLSDIRFNLICVLIHHSVLLTFNIVNGKVFMDLRMDVFLCIFKLSRVSHVFIYTMFIEICNNVFILYVTVAFRP